MQTRVFVVVEPFVTDVDSDTVIVSFPVIVMAAGIVACDRAIVILWDL